MQRSGFLRAFAAFVLLVSLPALLSCGQEEQGTRIIIEDPTHTRLGHNLYAEAGGLGGKTAHVNVGELAILEDQKRIAGSKLGAIPGIWVRIRTLYDEREGWIELKNTRPAPAG